jgi:hypothetical protein
MKEVIARISGAPEEMALELNLSKNSIFVEGLIYFVHEVQKKSNIKKLYISMR